MKNEWKKQKKSFAALEAQLEEANDSDLTDSDKEEDEQSHFQFLFQQVHSTTISNMKMKEVILLDNEFTMDLFCNQAFITGVHNTKEMVTVPVLMSTCLK
jgi:hypothetical protein